VTSSSLTLSWTEPSSAATVSGYDIYRNGVQVGTSTSTSFADTGLTGSTAYAYTVAAFGPSQVASAQSTQLLVTTPASAVTAPAFVQVTQNQVSSGTHVSAAFNSAVKTGNMIVAYVIWSNGGSVSLADSHGNAFTSARAAVTWGSGYSAQVFYAPIVAGGSDTVTATFQTAVSSFGVLYIHEYSGISLTNPVDVTAAASGAGSALNSGSATTTGSNDLIFGAGVSDNNVSAAGTGFTSRDMSYGNITEDRIATSPGSYSATATHYGTNWGMEMVAFRAAQ
jgi:chitodextrinase